MRLHHAFILTKPGAPEGDLLTSIGMTEGSSNTHPGQGSANRRFFFLDFALELGYFRDEDEARTGPGNVIRSLDRLHADDGSPLGLVFRAENESDVGAFPGFPYQPLYFDEGQHFLIGENADILAEPSVVLMPANLPNRPPQDLSAAPFAQVTTVRISTPVSTMSPALEFSSRANRVEVLSDEDHLLEVEFGGGLQGQNFDLRPDLPLVIRC